MAADDHEAFADGLTALLTRPAGLGSARPDSPLPRLPLALAAIAHRKRSWGPLIDTDYLPHALGVG
ncbi:hypothetical protein [Kitasatospora sp. NPDC090091]|uniref:hypothetical protein n=1 Tax=Kitasatospora sp. NPDC090091 TaxID=3364081 RepID=UPI00381B50EA